MYKINKIGKFAFALLGVGIVLLILMIFSIIGAFASVATDMQIESNLFYGLPNQKSSIKDSISPNTFVITNNNLSVSNNNESEKANLTYQFDVFKSEYKNSTNEIIIKSENGDNIVAPGSSNAEDISTFVVLNDSSNDATVDLDYKLEFNDDEIPLKFKVIDPDGNYLLGSENLYEDASKINGVSQSINVPAGEYRTYKFPWYWEFEEGQDARDTILGYKTCSKPLTVTLGLKGESPEPVPPAPEPMPEGNTSVSTGDIITIFVLGMLVIIAFAGSFVLFRRKRRA